MPRRSPPLRHTRSPAHPLTLRDRRHAYASLTLNAGGTRRLGHSVAMLMSGTRSVIEDQDLAADERIARALAVTAYERVGAETGPLTRTWYRTADQSRISW